MARMIKPVYDPIGKRLLYWGGNGYAEIPGGGLDAVSHDDTLTGDGTAGNPLMEVSNFRLSPLYQTTSQGYTAQVFPLCLEFQQQTSSYPPSTTAYTESDAIVSI
jgi:hypothetical protein